MIYCLYCKNWAGPCDDDDGARGSVKQRERGRERRREVGRKQENRGRKRGGGADMKGRWMPKAGESKRGDVSLHPTFIKVQLRLLHLQLHLASSDRKSERLITVNHLQENFSIPTYSVHSSRLQQSFCPAPFI